MSEDQGYPDPLPGSSQPTPPFPMAGQNAFGDISELAQNMMANPALAEMYKTAWTQQSNYMALMLQQQQQMTGNNSGKLAMPSAFPAAGMLGAARMPMMANPVAMMNMMQAAMASAAYMDMGAKKEGRGRKEETAEREAEEETSERKAGDRVKKETSERKAGDRVKEEMSERKAGDRVKEEMSERKAGDRVKGEPEDADYKEAARCGVRDRAERSEEEASIEQTASRESQQSRAVENGGWCGKAEGGSQQPPAERAAISPALQTIKQEVEGDCQDDGSQPHKAPSEHSSSQPTPPAAVSGGRANRRKPQRPTQIYRTLAEEEETAVLDDLSDQSDGGQEDQQDSKPSPAELERQKALYAETGSIHSDLTEESQEALNCQRILKRPPRMRQDPLSEDSNDSHTARWKLAKLDRPSQRPARRKKAGPGGKYRSYLAKAKAKGSALFSYRIPEGDIKQEAMKPEFSELERALKVGGMLPAMAQLTPGLAATDNGPAAGPLTFLHAFGETNVALPELTKLSALGDLSNTGFKPDSDGDTLRSVAAEAFPVIYKQFHEPFSFYGMRRIYDPYEGLNERSRIHAEVLSDCSVQACPIRSNDGKELEVGSWYSLGSGPEECSECLRCTTAAPRTYSNLAEIGPFWCHVCGESFNRKGELFNHLSVHTQPDDDFVCEECGKAFDSRAGLSLHSRVHTVAVQPADAEDAPKFFVKTTKNPEDGTFWFKCPVCERKFPDKRKIAEHLWVHKWDKPYECDECDKRFASKFELKQHQLIHRSKQFQCPVCGKEYRRKFDMLTHMRYHTEDRYECKVCKERFAERWIFLEHSKIHSGNNPYECQICGSVFTRQSSLRDHQIIHSDERPHKCEVCQKAFKMKDHLRQHFRMHTGERKYACTACGETFVRQFLLTEHMRIHTGEKPFSCSVCHMLFRRNLDRRAHEVRYHNGQVEGFPCLECGKLFVIKSKLQKHMNTVHSDQRPYKCDLCTNTYKWKKSLMQHITKVHAASDGATPRPGRRGRPPGRPKVYGAPLPMSPDFVLQDPSVLMGDSELNRTASLPGLGIKEADISGEPSFEPSSALGAPHDEEDQEGDNEGHLAEGEEARDESISGGVDEEETLADEEDTMEKSYSGGNEEENLTAGDDMIDKSCSGGYEAPESRVHLNESDETMDDNVASDDDTEDGSLHNDTSGT